MIGRRAACAAGLLALSGLLASCASPPAAPTGPSSQWSGRLSLRIDSEPPKTFAAMFDLRGTPEAGELRLSTPLGNQLAQLQWAPGKAQLRQGSSIHDFDSVEALLDAATGAAIPLAPLFEWLAGRDAPVAGWQADLRQYAQGRVQATRQSPSPTADLRIIIDAP